MGLIDDALDEEHRRFRERADAFVEDVVEPRTEAIEADDTFPRDVMEAAGERGLLGVMLPQTHGGEGSDFLSYCLVIERLAQSSGAVAESVQGHTFAALPIAAHGTPDQQAEYLEPMARGERIGAMLLTEPGAGSSPSELVTTAEATGNGYRLDGEKAFGTNAGIADIHLVVARMRPEPADGHGVSVFLLPGVEASDGLSFDRTEFMGMRGHVTGDTTLDGAECAADAVLGKIGQGFRIAMGTIDQARTGLGAIGIGIGRAALDRAVDYADEREQGGQAVGQYQAVQVLLAEMDAKLASARHLVYDSATRIARGAGDTRRSSRAKYVASEAAEFVTRNAMQVHGGKGYSTALPLERYYRDAKILSIIGGTTEIQQTTVARELLKQ